MLQARKGLRGFKPVSWAAAAWAAIHMTGNALSARPMFTEDAGTVSAGQVDIEAGWGMLGAPCPEHSSGITVKTGMGGRADAGFTVPIAINPDMSMEDLEMSSKLAIIPGSLSAAFVLCTGEGGYSAVTVLDFPAGPLSLHLNAGARAGGGESAMGLTSIAADMPVYGPFSLAMETIAFAAPAMELESVLGLRMNIGPAGTLDLAGGVDYGRGNVRGRATAGLTKSF